MAGLVYRAHLLGPLMLLQGEAEESAARMPLPSPAAARSLLAYLLFEREQSHPRPVLAGTFWPDMPEARARRSLTQALWHIGRAVPGLTQADHQSVQISGAVELWVDVEEFKVLATACVQAPTQGRNRRAPTTNQVVDPQSTAAALRQVVQLYRGDLLEGFYDDWIFVERERLRELYLQALEQLVTLEKSAGQYTSALDLALLLASVDPLREEAHREVMRLYCALQRPEAALKQFEICRAVLRQDLLTEPSPETVALAGEIAARTPASQIPHLPLIPPGEPVISLADSPPHRLPLIGRDPERTELLVQMEAAAGGLGGTVFVEGEAGVGKTRLLQEVARDTEWRGFQVLWGHCHHMGTASPYAPVQRAVQDELSPLRQSQLTSLVEPLWLQALAPLFPNLASRLDEAPPLPRLTPALEEERLVNAFAELLIAWSQITPLVLIVEDLHWADTDTLDLLQALGARLRSSRVLLVGSYRADEARAFPPLWEKLQAMDRAGRRHRLRLGRLSAPATAELIRRSLGLRQPAPSFESRLFTETAGNPLFLLETLRALYDEKLLYQDEHGDWHTPWDQITTDYAELPLPPAVERVIARRLDHLDPVETRLLETGAVLGNDFDFALLQATSGLATTATLPALQTLVQRRFLEETPSAYSFSHDKIRHLVYQQTDTARRIWLHRRAGEALEAFHPERTASLAHHFYYGQVWDRAAETCQQAGERAAAVYANQEAATQYSRALEALAHLSQTATAGRRIALLIALEQVHDLVGQRRAQLADLQALERELVSPADRAGQALRWAHYHEVTADYPAAMQAAQSAVDLAQQAGTPSLVAAGLVAQGRALWLQARLEAAAAAFSQALQVARSAEDQGQQANALYQLGIVYSERKRLTEALEHLEAARSLFRSLGDAPRETSCLTVIGNVYNDMGQFERALEQRQTALFMHRAAGNRYGEAHVLYNLSITHHDTGDDQAALHFCRQALEIAVTLGDRRLEAYDLTYLGLLLEADQPEIAAGHYRRALEIRREIGQPAMCIDSLAGLARAALRQNRLPAAREHIDQALAWVAENGPDGVGDIMLVYLTAHQVLQAAGEPDRAAEAIKTAHALLMTWADRLPDDQSRRHLLEDVVENRLVISAHQESQADGPGRQVTLFLPRAGGTSGHAGQPGELVPVTWAAQVPDDDQFDSPSARRQHRLARLLQQAGQQGASPAVADLAAALGVSQATIKRDLAALRAAGSPVQTRGSRR